MGVQAMIIPPLLGQFPIYRRAKYGKQTAIFGVDMGIQDIYIYIYRYITFITYMNTRYVYIYIYMDSLGVNL